MPLPPKSKITLIGKVARETPASGGGAAGFDPGAEMIHYEQAMMAFAKKYGVQVSYSETVSADISPNEVAVVFVNMLEHEYMDRPFELPKENIQMIKKASEVYGKTIVVASVGSGMEMSSWIEDVDAVIYAWHPGTYGAIALAEVVFGAVSPSGKLPFSIEKDPRDSHYHGRYLPEDAKLERDFQGWDVPKGQFDIPYEEEIFTGYRWYDSKGISPLFPFGHGLSYSSFELSQTKVALSQDASEQVVELSCDLKNTGEYKASQVLQVYVRDPESAEPRPLKELKAFQRKELEPGQVETLEFSIPLKGLRYWSSKSRSWTLESGDLEFWLGFSSRDTREKVKLMVPAVDSSL